MVVGWLTVAVVHGGSMMMMSQVDNNEVHDFKDMQQTGLRLNRDTSDHLDHNLESIPIAAVDLREGLERGRAQLPQGVVPPADIPEGFDPSTLEPQDDGQFCVYKTIPVEGTVIILILNNGHDTMTVVIN